VKITAVMVTGLERGNPDMPLSAIRCFLGQTWPDKELLIINHGDRNYSGENVRDIKVHKTDELHCGALRNLAFNLASGDWLMTWDDDDLYAPERMEVQAMSAEGGALTMLKNRTVVDVLTGECGVRTYKNGSLSSMLYPKNTHHRFVNIRNGSDAVFVSNFSSVILMDNDPKLYIRTWHGGNLTGRDEVMRDLKPSELCCGKSIQRDK